EPTVVRLLLGLLDRREQRVEVQRRVLRNVSLVPSDIANGPSTSLEDVTGRVVEGSAVEPGGRDQHRGSKSVLGVRRQLRRLSRKAGDLVPLVVDERLEGEMDSHTVLGGADELLTRLELIRRVGRQLGHSGESAIGDGHAAVLAL